MLSPGVELGNRYRLDERIASGGMGDVWRGTDQVLGRTVAVKILLPALLDEPGFAERFRGEARTMATINHPGVVDVYDYGSDQQVAFLVMEYVEGDALSRTLARVGRLTPARTMALVAQAADALQAAHDKGIVHRDVKPGNLLVRPNGTLVLTDFGIARSAIVGQLTAAGSVLGTASYISPEQAAGAGATPTSDVYALGVVAYQCLAGRRPFEGDNPLEIAIKHVREAPRPLPADIPPAVRAIVDRSLAKDPAARWPTASTLAAVARQAAANLAAPAHSNGGPAPVPAQANRGPTAPGQPGGPAHSGRSSTPPHSGRTSAPLAGPPNAPASPAGTPAYGRPVAPRPPAQAAPPAAATRVPPRPPTSPVPAHPAASPAAPGHYNRGAATVPAARPQQPAFHYPRPPAPPASGGVSRPLLVLLLILLGVLVVVCSGVISYQLRQQGNSAATQGQGMRLVSAVSQRGTGGDESRHAPYRRVERAADAGGVTR